MHEASIASPLLRIVLEEYAKNFQKGNGPPVSRIHVDCGILLGLEATTLKGCFSILAEGTVAEKAELLIDFLPMKGECRECMQKVTTNKKRFFCPACQSSNVVWQGGKELFVRSIILVSAFEKST